jgi:hypothetical protein
LLSGTGANLGKYVSLVNQLLQKNACLAKVRATCVLNARQSIFVASLFLFDRKMKFAMLAIQ